MLAGLEAHLMPSALFKKGIRNILGYVGLTAHLFVQSLVSVIGSPDTATGNTMQCSAVHRWHEGSVD